VTCESMASEEVARFESFDNPAGLSRIRLGIGRCARWTKCCTRFRAGTSGIALSVKRSGPDGVISLGSSGARVISSDAK